MASMVYSESFISKRADVISDRTPNRIDTMLRTIERMPGVGSALVAPSIISRHGTRTLKALVNPYLIIYQYDHQNDTVYILDLVASWTVH